MYLDGNLLLLLPPVTNPDPILLTIPPTPFPTKLTNFSKDYYYKTELKTKKDSK